MFFHLFSKFLERKAWKAMKRSKTYDAFNPFIPVGFPIEEKNRLASDRVKSISGTLGSERVKVIPWFCIAQPGCAYFLIVLAHTY